MISYSNIFACFLSFSVTYYFFHLQSAGVRFVTQIILPISILYFENFLFFTHRRVNALKPSNKPSCNSVRSLSLSCLQRRRVKKVLQLHCFKFARKTSFGPRGFRKLKKLELTTTQFESNLFGFNTTLVFICDSKQIRTRLGF